MSNTSNLDLERPDKGDTEWHTSLNSNMTKLDSGYGNNVATIADLPQVYIETGTFNFTTGDVITLPVEVDAINEYSVTVTPTTGAGGDIGFIYVTKTTSQFTVHCSANNTTDTFAAVIYYLGDINSYGGSIYRRWYVSTDAAITDHGDDTDAGSFAWVLDQIGASPAVVELPANKAYVIQTTVICPENIHLIPQNNAVFTDDGNNADLTINGSINAGSYQIFDWYNGSGSLVLNNAGYANAKWFGATGDGTTTDTGAIQNAFTCAYESLIPVYFPNGTYLTGTITYYGQSFFGDIGSNSTTTNPITKLLGKDSEDILTFPDPTAIGKAYLSGTIIKDIKLTLNDGTNASGSFTRNGVGNACIALPNANGAGVHTYGVNYLINGKFENVSFDTVSYAVGGQNASCAIYQQAQPYNFSMVNVTISRFYYGWRGDYPTSNEASEEYAPDCFTFDHVSLNQNTYPLRIYNSLNSVANNLQIYGSSGQLGFSFEEFTSLSRSKTYHWTVNGIYMDLNSATTGEAIKIEGLNHVFNGGSLKSDYGSHYITWDASQCTVNNVTIHGSSLLTTVLRFGTDTFLNRFINVRTRHPIGTGAFILDNGDGNVVEVAGYDVPTAMFSSRPISHTYNRQTPAFERSAGFLHNSPSGPYWNNEDLYIVPSDINWESPVLPTVTKDATIIESGEYVTLPSPGGGYFSEVNKEVAYLGYRIPEAKVRVYVKLKAGSSAGTQYWYMAVNAVNVGGATLSVGTTWTVGYFDADCTGLTKGHKVEIVCNSAAATQNIAVAWIGIVPFEDHDIGAHIGRDWGVYDFSVNGGAAGGYALGSIFNNAVITRAWYQVIAAPTSGGAATIAIGVYSDDANGIVTATAYNNAIFAIGYHDGTPDGTVANFTTQTTAQRAVSLVIGTSALTAGKIKVWWEYIVGE